MLARLLDWVLCLWSPAVDGANESPTSTQPSQPGPQLCDRSQLIFKAINEIRRYAARLPLSLNRALSEAAKQHAGTMAATGEVSHTAGNCSLGDRLELNGYAASMAGQNIASGFSTVTAVMNAWLDSRAHANNMISTQWTDIGVGTATNGQGQRYWCVVFGLRHVHGVPVSRVLFNPEIGFSIFMPPGLHHNEEFVRAT